MPRQGGLGGDMMRFVDTNILLYWVSQAPEETRKQQSAAQILDSENSLPFGERMIHPLGSTVRMPVSCGMGLRRGAGPDGRVAGQNDGNS